LFIQAARDRAVKSQPRTHLDNSAHGYLGYLQSTLPRGWSAEAAHIRLIAEHLDKVERGEIDRLAIHMPPRHGKSETVTYRFPVRWLEKNPKHNVLVTGYNERFARKFGRRTRNLATERGIVSGDKAAADEWETKDGGLLMTRGVGSPPTGTGFNLIVIDDPVRRREDAESETLREKVWDWYTDDLYSRLEPSGAIVLIMTLWHEDDIGARAVASEPGRWTVLKLPAISDEGEALWPERFDVAALQRIRDVMKRTDGERSFEALYQQNPTPRQGNFFKVANLKIVDAVPANLQQSRAWDIGATTDGDYTVGVKMGTTGDGKFYVLDVVRGQWTTDERDKMIRQTAALDGKSVKQRLPQDPGAAGKSQASAFVRLLQGFTVRTATVSGDKMTRADPFSSQVNAENVFLFAGQWNHAFIEEFRQFPNGKRDDQVDAAADAFNDIVKPVAQVQPSRTYSNLYG
jgi:predicted phage terminase large subunit-like protein